MKKCEADLFVVKTVYGFSVLVVLSVKCGQAMMQAWR